MDKLQLLLLAAGASRRMGQPKPLLKWGTETLIEHQVKNLLATHRPVSIVLGAHSEKISDVLKGLPIAVYRNKDWKEGMGSSIAFGVLRVLEKNPSTQGILIALIDQPLLTTAHFNKMLSSFETGKKHIIISSSKKGWDGAPVLFDKMYFSELMKLTGDAGAKVLIKQYKNALIRVEGGALLQDMDTHDTYLELLENFLNEK